MAKTPKSTGKQIRRTKLRYDMDLLNREIIFRVDLILRDANNNIPTPVTPLLEARLVEDRDVKAIPRRNFEPRQASCIFYPNSTEVTRTVYLPYRPKTSDLKNHLAELISYPDIVCVDYQGETHEFNLQEFL
jgi:hypothetical protein